MRHFFWLALAFGLAPVFALPVEKVHHTRLYLRVYPPTGVNVSTPGWDGARADLHAVDLEWDPGEQVKNITLSRPHFQSESFPISRTEANQAPDPDGTVYYPHPPKKPLTLEADSAWWAFRAWFEQHLWVGVLGLLALVVGGGTGVYWEVKKRQAAKARLERLEAYEKQRDPRDSLLMQRVDNYMLVETLGKGGMATVYLGLPFDTLDKSQAVAVKILGRDVFLDEEFRARFRREVNAYQKLNHPNIVRLFNWGEPNIANLDAIPYMVLELVRGTTLRSHIPNEGLPWDQCSGLLEQAFAAVAFAHKAGVVHRDLKPDNMMLSEDKTRLKVMDFGLARPADAEQLTRTGTVMGTPAFMAPEQLSESSYHPAVDQYALGVIAYQSLTGRLPNEAEDVMQLLTQVLSGKPTRPTVYKPDMSLKTEAVILRMLERDPKKRFPDVDRAWQALRTTF